MVVSVPYTFQGQSGDVGALELDADFAALVNAINNPPVTPPVFNAGFVNKLRNNSLSAWFGGTSGTTTTGGGWTAEGIYLIPTGASVTWTQGQRAPNLYNYLQVVGAASVTDVKLRWVIESFDAAVLVGVPTTFQVIIQQSISTTFQPTITITHANTSQDNYTASVVDVNAVPLQVNTGGQSTLAYTWLPPAGSFNGISITIDFGNNFSSGSDSIFILGFDCRQTPGVTLGLNNAPPVIESRDPATDILWNKRFYQTSYANNTAPATVTPLGLSGASTNIATGLNAAGQVVFQTQMRKAPAVTYFDGAGSASKCSFVASGGSTFTDGSTAAQAPFNISENGFLFTGQSASTGVSFIHYAADARIIGA